MRHASVTPFRRLALASALSMLAGAGCNLDPANADEAEVNACTTVDECSDDAVCRHGMCMARSTTAPLMIAVEVTPRRLPNANEPLPFLFEPFEVTKPVDREFELPAAISVSGLVRDSGAVLTASISFTPTTAITGVSVKTVTASTSAVVVRKDADYTVQLFEGVEYRMLVRPTDPRRPPFRRVFVASRDLDLNIDYAALPNDERTFAITGGPAGVDIILSAFDRGTGEPVSSTATVVAGKAKLAFAPETEHFRLDIRVSTGVASSQGKGGDPTCDTGSPAFPLFSIPDDQLASDSGVARVRLPEAPQRVAYEGTVKLCEGEDTDPRFLSNLPIALRSTALMMGVPGVAVTTPMQPGLVASYNATTNASYDLDTREFRFCVEVIQGDYDIVVTPPSNIRCSLFAQHRLIQAPSDGAKASGMELALPEGMYVTGSLQTVESAPLKGASIDGLALGRTDASEAATAEGLVTRFNRSQQTTSDARGAFKLPVDSGSYDLVIKPPANSGFPWQILYDIAIGTTSTGHDLPRINMVSPVALEGVLRSGGPAEEARLDGASVEAYALVSDGADGRRAISIGKATTNTDRRFLLLLPPSTQMHWGAEPSVD